jgi:hypothetical protein
MTQNPSSKAELNASALYTELNWFHTVLQTRFNLYFNKPSEFKSIYDIPTPDLSQDQSVYGDIVRYYDMTIEERIVLILALSPHICPQILDMFFTKNEKYGRGFTEFGGVKGNHHSGFLPTGETAAFISAGNDILERINILKIFDPDHYFSKYKILSLEKDKSGEPLLSGTLTISRDYLSYFTSGASYKPTFSSEFPAQPISTKLDWEDLVLE